MGKNIERLCAAASAAAIAAVAVTSPAVALEGPFQEACSANNAVLIDTADQGWMKIHPGEDKHFKAKGAAVSWRCAGSKEWMRFPKKPSDVKVVRRKNGTMDIYWKG